MMARSHSIRRLLLQTAAFVWCHIVNLNPSFRAGLYSLWRTTWRSRSGDQSSSILTVARETAECNNANVGCDILRSSRRLTWLGWVAFLQKFQLFAAGWMCHFSQPLNAPPNSNRWLNWPIQMNGWTGPFKWMVELASSPRLIRCESPLRPDSHRIRFRGSRKLRKREHSNHFCYIYHMHLTFTHKQHKHTLLLHLKGAKRDCKLVHSSYNLIRKISD